MNEYKLNHYVCAVCWGVLAERVKGGEWIIECANHGSEHEGFVTAAFAEGQRKKSVIEACEVSLTMADLLKLKRASIQNARRALYGDGGGL